MGLQKWTRKWGTNLKGHLQAMTEKGGIFTKTTDTKGCFGIETTQKHLS